MELLENDKNLFEELGVNVNVVVLDCKYLGIFLAIVLDFNFGWFVFGKFDVIGD